MKYAHFIIVSSLLLILASGTLVVRAQETPPQQNEVDSTQIGAAGIDVVVGRRIWMASNVLGESRELYIHLPESYNDSLRYPLILVLDAEVTFKSFAAITELLGDLGLIPPCVVVGLPIHGRHLEYAPVVEGVPDSGDIGKMLVYFSTELFPFLASHYSLTQDRVLWAHSALGGFFATYVMLRSPSTFTGIIATSPSLRWIWDYVDTEGAFEAWQENDSVSYHISYGGLEIAEDEQMNNLSNAIRTILESKAPKNLDWHFSINENRNHDTNGLVGFMNGLIQYFLSRK